jgi:predicted nucleic acid-binding Zn ribbon protein
VDDHTGRILHPLDGILRMGTVRINLYNIPVAGMPPAAGFFCWKSNGDGDALNQMPPRRRQPLKNGMMIMSLPAKTVTCACGHSFTSTRHRSWCEKCCDAVYYHDKDKNRHRFNSMYVVGVIVAVVMFLTYVFMELIATPLLTL